MTEILPPTQENIQYAAQTLRAGRLVAFPTETVYGLGANALNPLAVERIFIAKGRPFNDPLIVHLYSIEQLPLVTHSQPEPAQRLVEHFWPGPLTLILPKNHVIPYLVTAGLETVAVRIPGHPLALALLEAADLPIAAPSANRFGHPSPTTAQHVWHDLHGQLDLILDGGSTPLGVESTVIDVTVSPPRILRPGGVTREAIEAVIGPIQVLQELPDAKNGSPSPGLLKKHYAPQTEMVFFMGPKAHQELLTFLRQQVAAGRRIGVLALDKEAVEAEQDGALVYPLGKDLTSVARRLYDGIRWLDSQGVDKILCRDYGEKGLGLAIRDRLIRAASRHMISP